MSRPYLPGVEDGEEPHCRRSEHMRWRFEVDRRELCSALRRSHPRIGTGPCDVEILATGKGGWTSRLAIRASRSVELTGDDFHLVMGRLFGWSSVKSARFTLQASGDRITFHGRGLGHGVGMCQHGAMGMARAGATFRQILEHYYPGTELTTWP
jgi:stage II sporulation protein D